MAERLALMNGVTKYLTESRTEVEVRGRRGAARGGWDKLKESEEIDELFAGGVYLDMARFKSGSERTESGYILEQRHSRRARRWSSAPARRTVSGPPT